MSRRTSSTSYSISTCSSLASHCSTRSMTPVDKVRRGDIQGNIRLFERMLGMGRALGFEAHNRKSFHESRKSPSRLPSGFLPQLLIHQSNRNTNSPILVQRCPLAVSSRMCPRHHRCFRSPAFRRDARGIVCWNSLHHCRVSTRHHWLSVSGLEFKPSPSSQFYFAWQVYALSQRPFMKYVVPGTVTVLSPLAFGEYIAQEQLLSADGLNRALF